MPAYAQVDEFLKRVEWSNDHFESHKNSSLHALLALMRKADCSLIKVTAELNKIPQDKIGKYRDAMYYLVSTYPGLKADAIQWPAPGGANAALYTKTKLPDNYNQNAYKAFDVVKGNPPNSFLDMTCERFLLSSNENNGVIVIHCGHFQKPMKIDYAGRPVIDHMNSVLRVAKLTGAGLCVLHMTKDLPVCKELKDAVDDFDNAEVVYQPKGHMGSVNLKFENFAKGRDNCVVMGFDGTVCVHANIFGAPEPELTPPPDFALPLITLTNVVTSRAVIVNDGVLLPKRGGQELGVLFMK